MGAHSPETIRCTVCCITKRRNAFRRSKTGGRRRACASCEDRARARHPNSFYAATLDEVAEALGVSKARAGQIEAAALSKARAGLQLIFGREVLAVGDRDLVTFLFR